MKNIHKVIVGVVGGLSLISSKPYGTTIPVNKALAYKDLAQNITNNTRGYTSKPTPTYPSKPTPTYVPKPTAKPTPTYVPKPTAKPTPTYSAKPTAKPTPTYTAKPTAKPTPTYSAKPSAELNPAVNTVATVIKTFQNNIVSFFRGLFGR